MALSEIQTQVMEVYIATFNRAPDIDGLKYWVDETVNNDWTISDVSISMMESQEAQENFPLDQTDEAFINNIYKNVLGRDADTSGLAYWVQEIQSGLEKTQMILAIINGAKADTGSADDKQFLSNKKTVAQYFTFDLELNDVDLASNAMALVTLDTESINTAKDKIDLITYISNDTPFVQELDDNPNAVTTFDDNDIIYSYDGTDYIYAGDGDNHIVSGLGNDYVYTGAGNDKIMLREGNDTLYSGDGDDIIYGNTGDDIIHAEAGDDTIYGNEDDDTIYGEAGNDVIYSGVGNDYIQSGLGDDIIYADDGDDIIYTDDGTDFADAGEGDDIIYGGIDKDSLYGGVGDDEIYGSDGDDLIDGNFDNDTIYSGLGDDTAFGSEGDDIIYGNDGNDIIDGGIGVDKIYGEAGQDILTGGAGKDTFYFSQGDSILSAEDTITDFEFGISAYDKLYLINQGSETIYSTKVNVSTAATLSDATNLAVSDDGSVNAKVKWFIYQDNTYIVEDLSALATYDTTTDLIIKIQGVVDLTGLNNTTILFA